MKYSNQIYRIMFTLIISLVFSLSTTSFACTTMSCIAKNGHVWNANNEDGPFGVANFINVFPSEKENELGYYTLCYLSPAFSQGGKIQGGMNEAGLTYDFNTIDVKGSKNPSAQKPFSDGDQAILSHILKTMTSVDEVVAFFKEYWFQKGFTAAQMHVADRTGTFAIISASGVQLSKTGVPMVSTNYDIVAKDIDPNCWRNPTATKILEEEEITLETLIKACKSTAQKNGATMYSNIQNLTTGELWFFSKHDEGNLVKTSLQELLRKGKQSYSFNDLNSLKEAVNAFNWDISDSIRVNMDVISKYAGTYSHPYLGDTTVGNNDDGSLTVSFADGVTIPFQTHVKNEFFSTQEPLQLVFKENESTGALQMSFYEGPFWCFTIEKYN